MRIDRRFDLAASPDVFRDGDGVEVELRLCGMMSLGRQVATER